MQLSTGGDKPRAYVPSISVYPLFCSIIQKIPARLDKNHTSKKGHSDETPTQLNTPGKRAIYNNLRNPAPDGKKTGDEAGIYAVDSDLALKTALEIDAAIKKVRPDDWRGFQPKELVIKKALYDVLNDVEEVERIFKIIFQQHEY